MHFGIYPILQLLHWQQIAEVIRVPRHQNMLPGKNLCRDQDISITFPGSYLLYESTCNESRLFVKVEDGKAVQHGLCLLEDELGAGKLGGLGFQDRLSSSSELLCHYDNRKPNFLARYLS